MKKMVIRYEATIYMDEEFEKLSKQDQEIDAYEHLRILKDSLDKKLAKYDKDRVYVTRGSYVTDVDESEFEEELEHRNRMRQIEADIIKELREGK